MRPPGEITGFILQARQVGSTEPQGTWSVPRTNDVRIKMITLGPAYNEHFNAQKSARSNWVLVVTELFNTVVNDRTLAQQ